MGLAAWTAMHITANSHAITNLFIFQIIVFNGASDTPWQIDSTKAVLFSAAKVR
jgi:hypothetical protein